MNVLVVRAADDARRTADRLAAAGHAPIISPALVMRATGVALPEGPFDAAIATSAHAFVDAAALRRLTGLPLFVVGPRTADAARNAGWATSAVAPNAVDLAARIGRDLPPGARILYLAGRDRKPDLEQALAGARDLRVVEVYAAEEAATLDDRARAALASGSIGAVLHYSRRSAEIFLRLIARAAVEPGAARARHVAISADAAAPLLAAGLDVAIARAPNEDAMFTALDGIAPPPA